MLVSEALPGDSEGMSMNTDGKNVFLAVCTSNEVEKINVSLKLPNQGVNKRQR